MEIAKSLNKQLLRLQAKFYSEGGRCVLYEQMKQSEEWKTYKQNAILLQSLDLTTFRPHEAKAFWLNLYNALCIDGITTFGEPPRTFPARGEFYLTTAYIVGDHAFSLDDIEHGILRCNRKRPGDKPPIFCDPDPRIKFVIPEHKFDCRIHFALNCGAKSCPPVKVYKSDKKKFDKQLNVAAGSFCTSEVTFLEDNKIAMSKIFLWYKSDFAESDRELLMYVGAFLKKCTGAEARRKGKVLSGLLQLETPPVLVWEDYDWSMND